MLKKVLWMAIVTTVFVNLTPVCLAVPISSVPNPRQVSGGWVADMADLLTPETEATLNRQIAHLETKNSSEVAVVTVPDTIPAANPKAFATELFNTWGIGKKDKNNGVLLLVSKGDRRVEIITGKGLTRLLPDNKVATILQQDVTPQFKRGQFDAGVLAGTNRVIAQLEQYDSFTSSSGPSGTVLVAVLGGLLAGIASVTGILLYRRRSSQRVFLAPEGDSRVKQSAPEQDRFHCETCQRRMQPLTAGELSLFLNEPQQMAQQLGSVKYSGWRCKTCQTSLYGRAFHLRATVLDTEHFDDCPTCQERTAVHETKVLQEPTWNRQGQSQLDYTCRCCGNQWQVEAAIPCLPLPEDAVTIPPTGRSRVNNSGLLKQDELDCPTHCAKCHYPMSQVSSDRVEPLLRQPEQVAQQLGNITFVGWHCPTCHPEPNSSHVHLRAYVITEGAGNCPNCQELTIEETINIVREPTTMHPGQRQVTRRCHCCGFSEELWEDVPMVVSTIDHSNSWSSSDNSSSWSSSDSSSSWSSGSSDFGGGSSDGGGAGSSW